MKFLLLLLFTVNAQAAFNPFPPNPIDPGSLTQKADLYSHDGAADAILSPGADGQLLSRDDAETTGLKWINPPAVTPTTVLGDMIRRGAAVDERLGVGTIGQLLTADGTTFNWQDAPVSLPDQTGKEQHVLTSDGTVASWGADLPDIISQNYKNGNVLANPQFENDGVGWTITGCVQTYPVTVPLKKSLKLVCTNETFSIKQESTNLIDFKDQQGAFDLQIKTTADGVQVASLNNSVRNTSYTQLASTTFKRYKQIGLIVDGVSNGLEVYSDTNFTGEIIIDDTSLGLGNLTQEVQGALTQEYTLTQACNTLTDRVGEIEYNLGTATITNRGSDLITIEDDVANTRTKFTANKKATVVISASAYANVNGHNLSIFKNGVSVIIGSAVPSTNFSIGTSVSIELEEGEFFTIASNDTIPNYAGSAYLTFTATYVNPTQSTIATQQTELTAKTVNSFAISYSTSGVSVNDDFDIMNDAVCTLSGAGDYIKSCTYKHVFTSIPIVVANICDSGTGARATNLTVTQMSLTGFEVNTRTNSDSGGVDEKWCATITKTGTDINKTATIIGDFAQIKSDDLVLVEAHNNDAENITSNTEDIPFKTTIRDVNNLWTNAGNTGNNTKDAFTAPKTANYDFDFSIRIGGGGAPQILMFVNGATTNDDRYTTSSTIIMHYTWLGVALSEGDVVTFRTNTAFNLTGDPNWHKLRIIQRADKESIVRSLMKGQTTKCQTKYLSADVSTNGTLSDYTFNNLVLLKKYIVYFSHHCTETMATVNNKDCLIRAKHNAVTIDTIYTASGAIAYYRNTLKGTIHFAASSSLLEFETAAMGNMKVVSGENSWVRLCELPETNIETTEFN